VQGITGTQGETGVQGITGTQGETGVQGITPGDGLSFTDSTLNAEVTQAELDLKARIANPTFTGTPAAPTANAGTNTTQLATTAFVTTAVDGGGGKWGETGSDIYYNSGKVGIGKNNPSQKLDIVGNIAVSGTVDGVDISTLSTTVDALKWNVNNHTDLHSKTGGPAPKTQIVAGVTDISGSGFIRIYTASGEILCGQPVCEDISNDGPIKATTPSETTPSWKILGIALSTVVNGAAVSILANGYTTARRTTKYLGIVRNETIMDPIKMGVDDGTYGMADTLYGDSRTVNLNGTINFKDSGGDSNYSANERYPWLTFTVAAGKKILVKINSFYFEFGSSVAYDHLGVEYSTDGTSWEKLNDTIAPTWSNWLYYASESAWKTGNNSWVKKFFGGYNSNITGNGGGWMFGENSADILPDDVGNYYPSNTLDTWHVVNAQYIRFHFRSDSSTERSGWNIDIASAETSTYPAPTIIGEPLYIDTTDYTKLSDTSNNNTSGHHIGYVAATDANNDSVYIRVADFSIFDGAIGPQGVQGEKGNTGAGITAGTGLSLTGTTLNAEVTQAELDIKQNIITAGNGLSLTGTTLNAEVTQAELDLKYSTGVVPYDIIIPCSDEKTDLVVADNVVTFAIYRNFTLTKIGISLTSANNAFRAAINVELSCTSQTSQLITTDGPKYRDVTLPNPLQLLKEQVIAISIKTVGFTAKGLKIYLLGRI
jgi:hypothetical protein